LLHSDAFVLPSRREGMSNALMEAMLKAVPCVATDITGAQDLITHNVSGLLVPVKDIHALSDALVYILQNPVDARRIGLAGRAAIIEKCDMNLVAASYAKKYADIL